MRKVAPALPGLAVLHSPGICHGVSGDSHEVIKTNSNLLIIPLGMTEIDSH